ncbi:MAG: lipid-A-disaccharide synthase [Elusimicrobia bacterium]|nr:lipid-A-disaccharide synthase [Elusimicrobiota bacterium]
MSPKRVLVVAGDPSGDLHASHLVRALKRRDPALEASAVGGAALQAAADEFLEDLASRGVTGFWEPARQLPFLASLRRRLKAFMAKKRPHALICVDYYGFNRRVLGLARSLNIPAYYYISPQVWASRPGRVQTLKALVRRMLVIFPFEEELYRKAGVPCLFVGHPLLDLIPEPSQAVMEVNRLFKVGLLPGSRSSEVSRHLPVFLDAFDELRRRFPASRALVFASRGLPDSAYDLGRRAGVELVRESGYELRAGLDIALTSSGTATLENALLGLPMVVVYKMSWPTYALARLLVRVPYIAMANLLAARALVPELIQGQATPRNVADAATEILSSPGRREEIRRALLSLRGLLGQAGAADRAAESILGDI